MFADGTLALRTQMVTLCTVQQSVEEVAQAVAQLKNLQESHYEDHEKASEPLEVPAEIVQLAEFRRRRTSDRAGQADL